MGLEKGKKRNREKIIAGELAGPDQVTDSQTEQPEKKLTPKEEAFCQNYIIDFNGAKAARTAGYSEDTAKEIAAQNLAKIHIQKRISELRTAAGKDFNITRERIALEYSRLAFFDPRKMYDENGNLKPVHQWGDDEAAAVAGVEIETLKRIGWDNTDIDDDGNITLNEGGIATTVAKIKHASKRDALDSLVKLMGYAAPVKNEFSGPNGGPLDIVPLTINVVQPKKDEDDLK